MRPVTILYTMRGSRYEELDGVECYDVERDARTWDGGTPVVTHPPCRFFSFMAWFAGARYDPDYVFEEIMMGVGSVGLVRLWGGLLEQPEHSNLFKVCDLPRPGDRPDEWGGYTISVEQCRWGHKALKKTWLYIVGVDPSDLPPIPEWREPTHVINMGNRRNYPNRLPECSKRYRHQTPLEFAEWLVEAARRTTTTIAGRRFV